MVVIEIRNGDVFYFHENVLRFNSSYIDDQMKYMDERESPVKLHLDWDTVKYVEPGASRADRLSLSMKIFTQWIYRVGAKTFPDEDPIWSETTETLDILINLVSLGCKLNMKDFQDDVLKALTQSPFDVHYSVFKDTKIILRRPELSDIIIKEYALQLERYDDMESIRTEFSLIESIMSEDSDESPNSGIVIAAILNTYNKRVNKMQDWIKNAPGGVMFLLKNRSVHAV